MTTEHTRHDDGASEFRRVGGSYPVNGAPLSSDDMIDRDPAMITGVRG